MQGRFMYNNDLGMAVKSPIELGQGGLFLCPRGLQVHQGTEKAQWRVLRMLLAIRDRLRSDFSAAVLI